MKLLWSILLIRRSAMMPASTGSSTLFTSAGNAEDLPVLDARLAVFARVATVPTTSREEALVLPGSTGTCSVSSVTVKHDDFCDSVGSGWFIPSISSLFVHGLSLLGNTDFLV
eukprot:21997_1